MLPWLGPHVQILCSYHKFEIIKPYKNKTAIVAVLFMRYLRPTHRPSLCPTRVSNEVISSSVSVSWENINGQTDPCAWGQFSPNATECNVPSGTNGTQERGLPGFPFSNLKCLQMPIFWDLGCLTLSHFLPKRAIFHKRMRQMRHFFHVFLCLI